MEINNTSKPRPFWQMSKCTGKYLLYCRSFGRKECLLLEGSDMSSHLGKYVLAPVNRCGCSLQTLFLVGMDLILYTTTQKKVHIGQWIYQPELKLQRKKGNAFIEEKKYKPLVDRSNMNGHPQEMTHPQTQKKKKKKLEPHLAKQPHGSKLSRVKIEIVPN